jgi:2-iminobutanoate/2-iminopropanoate deaminase
MKEGKMRKAVLSSRAPSPLGIYSQGIAAEGSYVFVSGQGPIDPRTGRIVAGGFREQAERTFRNVGEILKAAGASWANAVKTNVYLADLADFAEMNKVYARFLRKPYPARTTVQAGLLNILIEVDCVAVIPPKKRG